MSIFVKESFNEENTHLKFVIQGTGLYENGLYQLDVQFSKDYPYLPMKIRFDTKILHPNIDPNTGDIGLNILNQEWSPALTCEKALLSIQSFLNSPNFEYIFAPVAACEFNQDKEKFYAVAKEWVTKYADKRREIDRLMKAGMNENEAIKKLIRCGELNNIRK